MQGEGDGVHEPEEEIGSSIISSVITKCISKSGGKELGMKHANIIRVSFSFLRNGGGGGGKRNFIKFWGGVGGGGEVRIRVQSMW